MLEKVIKVLKDYKGSDDLVISETTTFQELELDSLDTVELIMNVEEEFNVTIEMNDAIKTVGDLMTIIENSK